MDWRGKQIDPAHVASGYYGHRPPCKKLRTWDEGYDAATPCACGDRYYSQLIGIEYSYDHPDHYDGVSAWRCPGCGTTWNRWTGAELAEGQSARRFGR